MNEDKKIEVPGPEDGPGTAEQLKQFYINNWKDITEGINMTWKTVKETVETVFPVIKTAVETFYKAYVVYFKFDPEIKRCYGIYKRTKKGRIAKKQRKRINKIISKRYLNK